MAERDIYQHFRKEERTFIDKMYDIVHRVESTYSYQVTEFLDPRQVQIAKSICAQMGLACYVSSDFIAMEYARLIVAPDYYTVDFEDFELALIDISYNAKFNHLTHSQVMGSLLNRLGIQRSVFGDILLQDGQIQVIINRSLVDYFTTVKKIAKASVSTKEVSFKQIIQTEITNAKVVNIVASSRRLDKVIAAVFNISRSQATKLVDHEKVKLNYAVTTKSAEVLELGDLVSVRGFGRFELSQDNGLSKNNKHKLIINKFSRK